MQYVKRPGCGDQLRDDVDILLKWFVMNEHPDGGEDDDYGRMPANPFNRQPKDLAKS